MDNCFTGRRDWSCQTSEKDHPAAGPVTECALPGGARYIISCLVINDVIASFSCLILLRQQTKGGFGLHERE